MPLFSRSSPLFRCAIGLLISAIAIGLRASVAPVIGDEALYAIPMGAVAIAAWFGGVAAGVVAAIAGGVGVDYLLIAPHRLVPGDVQHAAALVIFFIVGSGLAWQVTRWRSAEETLRASARQLAALMDATTESIWLVDRRGIVLAANATAAARVGRSLDEVLGVPIATLTSEPVTSRRMRRFEEVFSTGKPVRFSDRRDDFCFDHTLYPVFGAAGEVVAAATFSRDVTARQRIEAELHDVSRRLTYHVEHSPLAVIEWGPDMRLTRWAGGAERLFGWTAEEVLGKRIEDLHWVYEEDVEQVREVEHELITGTNVRRFSSNRNYRKDGTVVHCEWYNSALLDDEGRLQSILSLVLDVTRRKRLEAELRDQTEKLVQANRLKDEFLATLSHELRTPLNAILGWAQILESKDTTPEMQRRGLQSIRRNARAQARLVEDVLDISRIVTGSVRVESQVVNVAAVVEQALEAVRPAAEARGVTLESSVQPALLLVGDAGRLQQVMWNLLSNAVKFTPPGGDVRIEARRKGSDVSVSVSDTGIGIAPEFLPHVFERFTQADSSPTRTHGGLGLGLAIVRHIVELHGGTVAAESEGEGRGSRFTVTLPVRVPTGVHAAEAPGHRAPSVDRPIDRESLSGIRVLAVDDDPDSLEVVEGVLTAAGAVVTTAGSAKEAFRLLPRVDPAVLISDIAMPDEDGYTFIRRVRESALPQSRVAAIALTAYGHAADQALALAAGFDRHIAKPVAAADLISTIANLAAGASSRA